MKGRRTQYELFWEILVFCKQPKSFTSIIHNCNLNSKIAQEHLDFLLKKNYLNSIQASKRTVYVTTEKAEEFLHLFSQLYQRLFEKNPSQKK